MHCRYCFRRHYDYGADQAAEGPRWNAALAAMAADTELEEIILSGGDPLSLGNARLAQLLAQLAAMPHIRRIRIHTRTPVVLPARVDAGLLALLTPLRERLVIVVHANHPAEIDAPTATALRDLGDACTALLNQSVLLAGVNDDVGNARRIVAATVCGRHPALLPAPAGPGRRRGALRCRRTRRRWPCIGSSTPLCPGYLVPRLVREVAGAAGKAAAAA